MSEKPDRLFVPLATAPFSWFESGLKTWELRRYGRQYTKKHVVLGRRVELRKGYSGDSLWGEIDAINQAETIEEIFKKVPYSFVVPIARDLSDAVRICTDILGCDEGGFIAFHIERNTSVGT